MEIISLMGKLRNLKKGSPKELLHFTYNWTSVEDWIFSYLSHNPIGVQMDNLNGLDCTPRAVFTRIASKAGCPIQFLEDNNSFIFTNTDNN